MLLIDFCNLVSSNKYMSVLLVLLLFVDILCKIDLFHVSIVWCYLNSVKHRDTNLTCQGLFKNYELC